MSDIIISKTPLPKFKLWNKLKGNRKLLSIEFELTARCNNNCRHCYINLAPGDHDTRKNELSLGEIENIADQGVSLGALWCLLTGGEPLLRKDFFDIYQSLKKKGLLVSLFTNATLITQKHIDLLKEFPARNIEVSVYGVTETTYEKITRVKGSFSKFMQGMELIRKSGLKVRLKAMVLRSNLHEIDEIGRFCRKHTKDYYRFDPLLHFRYDGNPEKNSDIAGERLSPEEIVMVEKADPSRFASLLKNCDRLIYDPERHDGCNHLFLCRPGLSSCVIGPEGTYRLCSSLNHPDTVYDLRKGTLKDAFFNLPPKVHAMDSSNPEFIEKCRTCHISNLCMWCPAHAYLETQSMDTPVDYFCRVAQARKDMLTRSNL